MSVHLLSFKLRWSRRREGVGVFALLALECVGLSYSGSSWEKIEDLQDFLWSGCN